MPHSGHNSFCLARLVVVYLINIKNLAIQMPMVRWVVSFINLGSGRICSGSVKCSVSVSVSFIRRALFLDDKDYTIFHSEHSVVQIFNLLRAIFVFYAVACVLLKSGFLKFLHSLLQLSMANIFAVSVALTGLQSGSVH